MMDGGCHHLSEEIIRNILYEKATQHTPSEVYFMPDELPQVYYLV